jgi:L-cystine transport system permease protein
MNKIFDINYIFYSIPLIAKALPLTLMIMILSLIFGLILGLLLAAMKLKKNIVINSIANGYVAFIRGTPPLLQLFLVFYGLPQVLGSIGIDINDWDKVVFAIITFSLNSGAFLSEVMRSAYLAVDGGQREAALSVGMNNIQILRRVIIPQAFVIAVPNIGNIVISLLKETSYVFTIGVIDILGKAKLIGAEGYGVRQLEVYIGVALIYWAMCIIIERIIGLYEYMHSSKLVKNMADS